MKNRKLLLIVSIVLALTMSLGGTLAYLQDTDEAVNVMTLGNVDIRQNEQERIDETKLPTADNLRDYTQGKPLYPAYFTGTNIDWEPTSVENQAWKVVQSGHGALDKFVTVTNTGSSDAYVRTLIAYEGDAEYGPMGSYIHIVQNDTNVDPDIKATWLNEYIKVGDTTYTVCEYVYPTALKAGETSVPSLKQIYMNNKATNEVVKYYKGTYDVLVLTQAVQTNNFDTLFSSAGAAGVLDEAFGDVTSENAAEWFGGVWSEYNAVAFAVYCAEDSSLTFDRAETVPAVGGTYNGKTVTAVFTDVEETAYETHAGNAPDWKSYAKNITNVTFANKISPVSTASWFEGMNNLTQINGLKLLDTSHVTNMEAMFCNCQKLTSLDLTSFDTANVTNMINMFASCVQMESLTLPEKFVTDKVTSVNSMFYACGYNVETFRIDCTDFDVSGVVHEGNYGGQARWCKGCVFFDVFVDDKVIEPQFNCSVE